MAIEIKELEKVPNLLEHEFVQQAVLVSKIPPIWINRTDKGAWVIVKRGQEIWLFPDGSFWNSAPYER